MDSASKSSFWPSHRLLEGANYLFHGYEYQGIGPHDGTDACLESPRILGPYRYLTHTGFRVPLYREYHWVYPTLPLSAQEVYMCVILSSGTKQRCRSKVEVWRGPYWAILVSSVVPPLTPSTPLSSPKWRWIGILCPPPSQPSNP